MMSGRRDDFDVVLNVDRLLIRADEIVVENQRRKRRDFSDVAGDFDRNFDDVAGAFGRKFFDND